MTSTNNTQQEAEANAEAQTTNSSDEMTVANLTDDEVLPRKKEQALRIDMREVAVLKQVWPLSPSEKAKLDRNFIYRTSAADLIDNISTSHPFKDYLIVGGQSYEVSYIKCGYAHIKDDLPQDTRLLVSLRVNKISEVSLAVIMLNTQMDDTTWANYRKLDFSL